MLISTILVIASVWILSLNNSNDANAWWNADMWINNSFREQNPSDWNIIAALFGNWYPTSSPYNRYWDGFCLPNKVTYVHNMDQLKNMVRDTIYIIESWFYYIDDDLIPANCSAIIWKWTWEVILNGAGISLINKSNVILDNLIIDWDDISFYDTHYSTVNNVEIKNVYKWLDLFDSTYNRFNRIKSHSNTYGIVTESWSNNFFSECELFNNIYWLFLQYWSSHIINNCQIYNNSDAWIFFSGTKRSSINNTQVYNNVFGVYFKDAAKNVINNSHIYSNSFGVQADGNNENLLMSGNIYNNTRGFSLNGGKIIYYNTVWLFNNENDCNMPSNLITWWYADEANYSSTTDFLILLKPWRWKFDTGINIDRFWRTYPVDKKWIKFITPLSDFMKWNLDWIPELPIKYIAGKKIIKQVNPIWYKVTDKDTWWILLHEHNPNYFIASIDSETSELDDSIINYYYGDYTHDSEFTKNWFEKNCNINVMTVEYINNQNEFYEKLLDSNMPLWHTIYVLKDGKYDVTDTINVWNDCTAIVNYKWSWVLLSYYPWSESLYAMIYADWHENLVFDNLALDGSNNTNNNLFLDRYENIPSQNSTINYVQSFDSLGDGIQLWMLSNYNTIMNSQAWNNKWYGIELFLAWEHNIINNSIAYNNSLYGLRFGNKSKYNSINNSQFFNNGIWWIFSDLNTESNIINNIHTYNNENFGLNFKWSSWNTLNNIYSYNNNIWINIEDDSAINNVYISDIFVFANKESNLQWTNGNDKFLHSDYIYISGLNSPTPSKSNVWSNDVNDEFDTDVNLVADLSGGIWVSASNDETWEDNTKSLQTNETAGIISNDSLYWEWADSEDEENWNPYTAAALVLSWYYFNWDDVSSWTKSYKENCSGKIETFFDSDFAFGTKLCAPTTKEYIDTDNNLSISNVIISGINIDYDCEYKITDNFILSFESDKEITWLSINVWELEINLSSEDWYKTWWDVLSWNEIISTWNYIYSGIFTKPESWSGLLSINFSYWSNTGKVEFTWFHVVFTGATLSEDEMYIDLRSDYWFEVKNKSIYLQDNSIFILKDSNISLVYPIHMWKCSAIIWWTNSVLSTAQMWVNIVNFDTGSTYSIIDHVWFGFSDTTNSKILSFDKDSDFITYYTIINKSTINGELLDALNNSMAYSGQLREQLENYIKFLPKKPDEVQDAPTELYDNSIIWDIVTWLDMSCQYVTNVKKVWDSNSLFFSNGICDTIGVIPTWTTNFDFNRIFYIFGLWISKQVAPVWYNWDWTKMSGLANQYINTSYIWETNPILYTNPGSILFSGAFNNNVATWTNYEIGVQFTNQWIINHNFDIILTFKKPKDIEWHLEIKRGGVWENVWTGILDLNYKELEDIRIVVKTPETYLEEIEWTLYIWTEEYGNNKEVFRIQTIADQTTPSIVWLKNIGKWGIWWDEDNIWQVKTNGKYTVKVWYDYVDSPDDCNSWINMNEYTELKEINLKDYDSWVENLNNKYVCIYAKDIVSNVVSTSVSNQIHISIVNFVDDIMPWPVYYDSVSVSLENVYNYGYNWVVNKWRCNEQGTNWLNRIPYDGNFILNSDKYNNKYMCIKAEDSLWNKRYFSSANSANIIWHGDMVYFEDGVNPSWNNEDIVSIWFNNEVEFVEKTYKWVSNALECTDTGWMVRYTKPIVVDNQYLNWYYFCMYTLESGSNIENYLISPTPLKVDVTNPTTPTIVSPENGATLTFLVIDLTWAYDNDAWIAWYEYQISQNISFMEIYDYGFTVASWNSFSPKFDGEAWIYYIKIRSVDKAGNISDTWDNIEYLQFNYDLFSGFEFTDITWAELWKKYPSNVITIKWLAESGEVYVQVTNGVLYRNWEAKWSGARVKNDDTLSIRMTSSDEYGKKVISNLIILNKVIPWTIETREQDPTAKKYDISDEDKESVDKIFDTMMTMYADEWERMEMFYTMRSLLKDEIDLNPSDSGKLKYMLYLIEKYLNDESENGWKIHTAPNCKKYEISYDAKKDGYYSPDMMVVKGKISYFATITDLLRYIDSKNSGWECGYHIYKKVYKHNSSSAVRHISPSGKLYDIEYTKLWYTSPDLSTTKYFASVYDLKSYINSNNPAVNLLSWDHTVDAEFTPETYTAPNGKSYVIYHTDKWYMSYKFMSVRYFDDLDKMKLFIDKNNPKK